LHLLFGLGASSGRIWAEQSTQTGILSREPIVLGQEHRHLLLGNSETGQSVIALLLPDLHSVAPEARRNGFLFVTHGRLLDGWIEEAQVSVIRLNDVRT
jgi:hypothetical protein